MCGIAGFWDFNSFHPEEAEKSGRRMAHALRFRGPDSEGLWSDSINQVMLVHRRLSILDLSSSGYQPMLSQSGRYAIVFNGQIYNHLDLRKELESFGSIKWRGHSDTETLAECIDKWGIEGALNKAVGMFGLAVYDNHSIELTLARDRYGEKPVYYSMQRGLFIFGSVPSAIKAYKGSSLPICRESLSLYMRLGYIPSPHSIYENVYKLSPGCLLKVCKDNFQPRVSCYFEPADLENSQINYNFEDDEEVLATLENLLSQAVRGQLSSDVPLGAFLSGGIDSSLIVALMQKHSPAPVRTFTIGFKEKEEDESVFAKAVAKHLGCQHTEMIVGPRDLLDSMAFIPEIYDEPFADPSQIPTSILAKLARQSVTVALTGDGGDELFAGYSRYDRSIRLWRIFSKVPLQARRFLSGILHHLSPEQWKYIVGISAKIIPRLRHVNDPGGKAQRVLNLFEASSLIDMYLRWNSYWNYSDELILGNPINSPDYFQKAYSSNITHPLELLSKLDVLSYLPDDILVKVDRAGMAVSLENRTPFLDHRFAGMALSLPLKFKHRKGVAKWALRQILYKHVPKKLIERPKKGFSIPVKQWLRKDLRQWANDSLSTSKLSREGFFNPSKIELALNQHQNYVCDHSHKLWTALMFQAWLDKQADDHIMHV